MAPKQEGQRLFSRATNMVQEVKDLNDNTQIILGGDFNLPLEVVSDNLFRAIHPEGNNYNNSHCICSLGA